LLTTAAVTSDSSDVPSAARRECKASCVSLC
jgi:hypothetical protein